MNPSLPLPVQKLILSVFFISLSLISIGGTPVNGTTQFNSVSPGVKASGSASGSGITGVDLEGFNYRLTTASSANMVIEVWDGIVGTGNGVALYELTSSINPLFSGIYITANSGAQFDLISIGINAQSSGGGNATVTITGLDGSGNPISGATASGTASVSSLTTFNVNSINQFKGIRGIRITSSDIVYAFIDNIQLANVAMSTLPVNFIGFTAKSENNSSVQLNWSTASEQNADNFSVLHSRNATDWKPVGSIQAGGNSESMHSYSFLHQQPFAGINYYRLQQTDINGSYIFSKIISITIEYNKVISVYPNPVLRNTYVTVHLKHSSKIELYNSTGILMLQQYANAGVHAVSVGSLPAGIYLLKADGTNAPLIIE